MIFTELVAPLLDRCLCELSQQFTLAGAKEYDLNYPTKEQSGHQTLANQLRCDSQMLKLIRKTRRFFFSSAMNYSQTQRFYRETLNFLIIISCNLLHFLPLAILS